MSLWNITHGRESLGVTVSMNIAFCADSKYVDYLCVALNSVILSNKTEDLKFYIISADFTDSEKDIVKSILLKSPDVKADVVFLSINAAVFSKLPTMAHISIATYYRLLLPEILPDEVEKILYIDGDLLCLDSLASFYNQDLEGYAVSAGRDFYNDDVTCYNRLEYPFENGYFNAGVLLINLKYWRQNQIAEKAMDFITKHPEKCDFSDQDALNKTLNGKVFWTDFRNNCIISFFYHLKDFSKSKISIKYKREIEAAVNNPCIVHFTGGCKPWHEDYRLAFRNLYHVLYKKTFGKSIPKIYSIHGKELLKWKAKEFLTVTGIKKFQKVMQDETFSQVEETLMKRFLKN